jgi:hypothetical protein
MVADLARARARMHVGLDANPVAQNLPYLPLGPPARRKRVPPPLWLRCVKLRTHFAALLVGEITAGVTYDVPVLAGI